MNQATTVEAWTRRLLGSTEDDTIVHDAQRLAVGLGLAALFGAALGMRSGGAAIAAHALGVAAGLTAVCLLAVPALGIALAIADAPASARGLARATSRAAATAGLLLGGFAPGVALFAVTVEDAITVTLVGAIGLALSGGLAMRAFVMEVKPALGARVLSRVALPAFIVFAAVLGARIWWVTLPLVRGGL
jgi:hypothetical protein